MRKLIRNIASPQLMVAIVAAASFVFTPAIAQAGDKDHQHKKTEKMMKTEACKADEKACKDDKETKREASKPSISEVPKD